MTQLPPSETPSGTPWADLVDRLAGHTCLWQDLDGYHVEAPPTQAPRTSILWAWAEDGSMVRVRIDDDRSIAYLATCPADVATTPLTSWDPHDRRIHAVRRADSPEGGPDLVLEQYVDDSIVSGAGPITFLRARRT